MKKIIFASIGLAVLLPVNADENSFSISLGEKSIFTEIEYDINTGDNVAVTSSTTGIYANFNYYQTPSLSHAFEFATFSSASPAGIYSGSPGPETTATGYDFTVKPSEYLSLYSQYTFHISETIRPIIFGGLSYLKADITVENVLETMNTRTIIESAKKTDTSLGLIYGLGLDINFYKNISFVFDYRIRPDIDNNSTDEINGSLKYQF